MPTNTHIDFVKCAVSGTPGTGTITVSTASSGFRGFTASDDGKYFSCTFVDGTAWETADQCLYTHAGTTLTRGTFVASSTGSALSLSSAATVTVGPISTLGNLLEFLYRKGAVIVRNDGSTTLSIAASTFTKLTPINTEVSDVNGWWDNANQKFLPTRAGTYLIIAGSQITMSTAATLVSYLLVARKNGTDYAHLARGWIYGAGNIGVSGACLVQLNGSTDYIEPFGWQNDTVNRTTVAGAERQFFGAVFVSEN